MKSLSSTFVMRALLGVMIASHLSLTACARKTLPAKVSESVTDGGDAGSDDSQQPEVQIPDANPTDAPTTSPEPQPTQTEIPSPLSRYTKTQYTVDLASVKKILDDEKLNLVIGYKDTDGTIQLESLESLAESKVATGTYPELVAVNLELRLVAIAAEHLAKNPQASQDVLETTAKSSLIASVEKLRAAVHALLFKIDGAIAPEGMDPNVRASEIARLQSLRGLLASKDLKDQIELWNPSAVTPVPAPTETSLPPAPTPTETATPPPPAPTPTETATPPTQVTPVEPVSTGEITAAQLKGALDQALEVTLEFNRVLLRKMNGDVTTSQYEDLKPLTAAQADSFATNKVQYQVSGLRLKATFEKAKQSAPAGSSEEQITAAALAALKTMASSAAQAYGKLEDALAGKTSKEVSEAQLRSELNRARTLKELAESPDTIKSIEALK